MFTRIALPLDGSVLAEQALPLAIRLARSLKASIVLLRVVELPTFRISSSNQNDNQLVIEAELYLAGVYNTILDCKLSPPFDKDLLDYRVIYADKTSNLAEIAVAEKASLLVMTTHGRTGLSGLVMGSFATRLVRHSPLPIVLLRPQQINSDGSLNEYIYEGCLVENENGNNPAKIVVPLDSLPGSETALAAAAELAHQLNATIYLLNVIPASNQDEKDNDKLKDAASDAASFASSYQLGILQEWKDEAFKYLEEILFDLEAQGLSVVT